MRFIIHSKTRCSQIMAQDEGRSLEDINEKRVGEWKSYLLYGVPDPHT